MKRRLIVALLGLLFAIVSNLSSPKGTNAAECHEVKASWYGEWHHGRITKSGEVFDMNALTAASNRIRMGSRVRLINPSNGKETVVKINDTGGFEKYGRQLDVSRAAAAALGFLSKGTTTLKVCVL